MAYPKGHYALRGEDSGNIHILPLAKVRNTNIDLPGVARILDPRFLNKSSPEESFLGNFLMRIGYNIQDPKSHIHLCVRFSSLQSLIFMRTSKGLDSKQINCTCFFRQEEYMKDELLTMGNADRFYIVEFYQNVNRYYPHTISPFLLSVTWINFPYQKFHLSPWITRIWPIGQKIRTYPLNFPGNLWFIRIMYITF